jgi:hypothetical protein
MHTHGLITHCVERMTTARRMNTARNSCGIVYIGCCIHGTKLSLLMLSCRWCVIEAAVMQLH